jgi:SAM-dependent methyltransferase
MPEASADENVTVEVTPEPIFQIATGFMAAKHLFVANELGLFACLASGPASLEQLASQTGVASSRLRVVADAMVALRLLERHENRYQNSAVAATFLAGDSAADVRPVLRFFDRLNYPAWANFEEVVRTGRSESGLPLSEEDQRIFSEGVEALQAGPAQALPAAYDFSRHQRVLDLGGGTGSWLLAILRRHPQLNGTLFELPMAASIARQRFADDPAGKRAEAVEGDFFVDPIPDGHDAVLVANVIHLFSPERNLELLQRIRDQVADGGRLFLADLWTDPTHTEPTMAALMGGQFLVRTGEGAVYSDEEANGWLVKTGWRPLEHKALAGPTSVVVAEAV